MAPFDRREFLRSTALVSAGTLAWPHVAHGGETATGRVVHVHHGRAAKWPRTTGRYRDFVDQDAVSSMLDEAVRSLKGGNLDEAWRAVFPMAAPETRRLSIKINNNNSTDPADGAGDDIDAIPEPVVAVIRGFVRAGGLASNVNVYDATNTAPNRVIGTWFRDRVRAHFPDALFNAPWPGGGASCSPRTCVSWDTAHTNQPPETKLSGAVLAADYVVNVPIVKRHGQANVTLGYKAHFGSVDRCDRLHSWVFADTPTASVLADIMGSPVVAGDPTVVPLYRKTVLTVGDMLFGQPCRNFDAPPRPWVTWGNEWPNCLIVSDDVVAAESVMFDLLTAEPASDGGCGSVKAWAMRFMQLAESKGQGIHEHIALPAGQRFNPASMTYTKIDYRFLDLMSSGALLRASRFQGTRVLLEWEHYFPGICEVRRSTQPDLADEIVLGSSPAGRFIDPNPPPRAFYRVRFTG